jgi:ribokinase
MNTVAIIVVGSFVQDLTFHCGEFPRPGETIIGRFATGPGGKGSNQAVAAARAGGRVAFIGAVGEDGFGEGARKFQTAEGITALLSVKTTNPTGAAGILVNSHGQNEIVVSLDANAVLTPADVEAHADTIRSASVLVAQLEANLEATSSALRLGRQSGLITILNPAPMRPDFELGLLVDVDILIPNEIEFATLAAHLPTVRNVAGDDFTAEKLNALPDEELQQMCRLFGVETIVVTLGSRGCFVSRPEGGTFIPAIKGIKVADTTGAGDAFVGAFATRLAELGREGIVAAARFANAGAAVSVTRAGTAPAMPQRAEIDKLLGAAGG